MKFLYQDKNVKIIYLFILKKKIIKNKINIFFFDLISETNTKEKT